MPSTANELSHETTARTESRVSAAIELLSTASASKSSLSKVSVAHNVEEVESHGNRYGFDNIALGLIIDILRKRSYIDQHSLRKLTNALYPRGQVRQDLVVKVLGSLGQGKERASLNIQNLLLKWLIQVYVHIESYDKLSQLYGLLFSCLGYTTLRTNVSHLLYLSTKREHVKPFRIHQLMELQQTSPPADRSILSLLQLYKNYYPSVVVGDFGGSAPNLLQTPDSTWAQKLAEIRSETPKSVMSSKIWQVKRHPHTPSRSNKRRKLVFDVPEVHTYGVDESSVTLEEVRNMGDFISTLDKMELPNQIAAVLDDNLFQKFLVHRPSPEATKRLDQWIVAVSEELFQTPDHQNHDQIACQQLLSKLWHFSRKTKTVTNGMQYAVQRTVEKWSDNEIPSEVFWLISQMSPTVNEKDSIYNIMDPLLHKRNNAVLKARTLLACSSLLQNWKVDVSLAPDINFSWTYRTLKSEVALCTSFIKYLTTSLEGNEMNSKFLREAALQFFTSVTTLCKSGLADFIIPPPELIYSSFFSNDAATVSRLCEVMNLYKAAFENMDTPQTSHLRSKRRPQEVVDLFNSYVMDICNCLWRNRAFNRMDSNAQGFRIADSDVQLLREVAETRGESLSILFSFTHYGIFARLSANRIRQLEDSQPTITERQAGPVTIASLKRLEKEGGIQLSFADFRTGLLQWLMSQGYTGVCSLLFSSMTSLLRRTEI